MAVTGLRIAQDPPTIPQYADLLATLVEQAPRELEQWQVEANAGSRQDLGRVLAIVLRAHPKGINLKRLAQICRPDATIAEALMKEQGLLFVARPDTPMSLGELASGFQYADGLIFKVEAEADRGRLQEAIPVEPQEWLGFCTYNPLWPYNHELLLHIQKKYRSMIRIREASVEQMLFLVRSCVRAGKEYQPFTARASNHLTTGEVILVQADGRGASVRYESSGRARLMPRMNVLTFLSTR